jgi:hypothetical protein
MKDMFEMLFYLVMVGFVIGHAISDITRKNEINANGDS